jgi:hypothetical protein
MIERLKNIINLVLFIVDKFRIWRSRGKVVVTFWWDLWSFIQWMIKEVLVEWVCPMADIDDEQVIFTFPLPELSKWASLTLGDIDEEDAVARWAWRNEFKKVISDILEFGNDRTNLVDLMERVYIRERHLVVLNGRFRIRGFSRWRKLSRFKGILSRRLARLVWNRWVDCFKRSRKLLKRNGFKTKESPLWRTKSWRPACQGKVRTRKRESCRSSILIQPRCKLKPRVRIRLKGNLIRRSGLPQVMKTTQFRRRSLVLIQQAGKWIRLYRRSLLAP